MRQTLSCVNHRLYRRRCPHRKGKDVSSAESGLDRSRAEHSSSHQCEKNNDEIIENHKLNLNKTR